MGRFFRQNPVNTHRWAVVFEIAVVFAQCLDWHPAFDMLHMHIVTQNVHLRPRLHMILKCVSVDQITSGHRYIKHTQTCGVNANTSLLSLTKMRGHSF